MNEITSPILLHIPHSSFYIPPDLRGDFLADDEALRAELLRMTDAYTDTLFPADFPRVVFPVSRLVCDPERFEKDELEPMAAIGMGCVYTHGSLGQRLRRSPDRETLLARYYRPHHRLLTEMTDRALTRFGRCLILDCHSFSHRPLPYEADQRVPRPDLCIGTDPYHTPKTLAQDALRFFVGHGLTTAINAPYSGALVPTKHYRQDPRVCALMIEVNRALYMDEHGEKTRDFSRIQAILSAFVTCIL